MADDDTTTPPDGTQSGDASASADAPSGSASGDGGEDVSVLRSRYAGQTAKVNELTSQKTALERERDELRRQLAEAQQGITSKDEAAAALVKAKDEELARERAERRRERIETRFPETFATLGDAVDHLTDDQLAATEARLKADAGEAEPPTPRGQNAPRDAAAAAAAKPREKSSADILAELEAMALPGSWGGNA